MKIVRGEVIATDPNEHIVLTGPIQGTVTLEDGEEVDVSAPGVVARDPEHALAIANAIGEYWADPSTPTHPDLLGSDVEFVHDPEQSKKNLRAALKNKEK